MSEYDFDLFVIGGGSGGVRAARMASGLGARVAIAEERYWGGTCVNVGCVPKKLYVYASHCSEDMQLAASYGWELGPAHFHWSTLRDNKIAEISRLNGIYQKLLTNAGVEQIDGRAVLLDPHSVAVGERRFSAKHILIATGGWPDIPQIPGSEHVLNSNQIFDLKQLPERIAIVGGGYIAVEFAGIFHGLGVDTTLVYRGPMFMRHFDDDVREHLARSLDEKGIKLLFNSTIDAIEESEGVLNCQLNSGGQLQVDQVLCATGRKPMTAGLGLEHTAVELAGDGSIIVDENFRTAEPSIFALGDVVGRMALTPVATAEGMQLVHYLFGDDDHRVDYDNIATAVFSQPNVATVGLTEKEARQRGMDIEIYMTDFRHMKLSFSAEKERVLMKLIVDKSSDKVLGCHMVGPDAGEIIQGLAIAMKAGATKAHFDATIGIHPTAAEEFVTLRTPVQRS